VSHQFKRSQRFAFIGIPVVAIACVIVALTLGQGSNPNAAMVPILAIVFGFVAVLLTLQRRDAEGAATADERATVAVQSEPVTDPTLVASHRLLSDLAVAPIDHAAIAAARRRAWQGALGSIDAGSRMMILIFIAVVPWVLFQFVWSLVIVVPIIAGYAGWLALRAVGPGGQLDQGFDDSAATLTALGLRLVERPSVEVSARVAGPGARASLEGALAFAGERHGRDVSIRFGGLGATTHLAADVASFEVAAKGERLRAADGSPATVAAALEPLRASSTWRGVKAHGDSDGVVVARDRGGGEHWMRDLWLAERLAAAAAPRVTA
jgi:hypothetical protein